MGGTAAGDKMTVEGKVMFDVAFDEGSAAGVTDQPVAEVLNQLTFRTRQLVDHFVQTAL
jgi:hypothetical protein